MSEPAQSETASPAPLLAALPALPPPGPPGAGGAGPSLPSSAPATPASTASTSTPKGAKGKGVARRADDAPDGEPKPKKKRTAAKKPNEPGPGSVHSLAASGDRHTAVMQLCVLTNLHHVLRVREAIPRKHWRKGLKGYAVNLPPSFARSPADLHRLCRNLAGVGLDPAIGESRFCTNARRELSYPLRIVRGVRCV